MGLLSVMVWERERERCGERCGQREREAEDREVFSYQVRTNRQMLFGMSKGLGSVGVRF